jgi:glycosyltransferase involved in cell wall biosynthesis
MKKLLIVGSNTIHTYNYIDLIRDYFDDILLITSTRREGYSVKSIELNFHLRPAMFMTINKIKQVVNEYNPSVVHIHQANSYSFLTLFALRNIQVPKVLTAWGSDVLLVPDINYLYRKMVQYALDKADVITSDSLYMANKIRELCSAQPNIVLVSFGIQHTQEKLIKENIVFTNRLHKSFYNIDKIIIAFEKFIKMNRGWRLVIAGVGEDSVTQQLVDLTERLHIGSSVEFTGWLDLQKNLDLYNKSKIFISVPDSDATSISLLEAISNNCICFVSNLPANCEHILDHVNGFIEDDMSNIDLDKYRQIDSQLQSKVNALRSCFYDKEYCRNIFYGIYDDMISDRGAR